ncbi:hypothetical protein F4808DRAFT_5364 [Astrocystis sublimbata]|nr:hypothetical protein F4808DRAFT_5364 [Astrocystis sublimbata]
MWSSGTDANQGSSTPGPPPGNSNTLEAHGFARPPPGFDPTQIQVPPSHGGLLNPAEGVEESVEDEIKRKISEVEKVGKKALSDDEKDRIAKKVRSLREGGWLEGLKLKLAGKDSVPIEYFNRLVAEHENTILKVAQINARADKRVELMQTQLEELLQESVTDEGAIEMLDARIAEEEKAKLQDDIRDLQAQLERCRQDASNVDLRTPRTLADVEMQRDLEITKEALNTARQTASDHLEKSQMYQQQHREGLQRENGLKTEIRELRRDFDNLKTTAEVERQECVRLRATNEELEKEVERLRKVTLAAAQDTLVEDSLQRRIAELEAERAGCRTKCESLEKQNTRLRETAALQEKPYDPDDLLKKIRDLQAELEHRDETIRSLEKRASGKDNTTFQDITGLQNRCKELRDSRNDFRNRWARLAVAENEPLTQFWEAVEATNTEIRGLYHGIERLCRALGITDVAFDTPQMLERIVAEVTGNTGDDKMTIQTANLCLRFAHMGAITENQSLKSELDNARRTNFSDGKSPVAIISERDMDMRVSIRTQLFREYRNTILHHLFNARFAFIDIAKQVPEAQKAAMQDFVDQYLEPGSLPELLMREGIRL